MTKTKHGHTYAEAFMIMWYACDCGHRERIWNSRDGVTPFGLGCPSCGGASLHHVDWGRDVYAPDHKASLGQRFWRDGAPDEAETREGTDASDFRKGRPQLETVTKEAP